MSFIMKLRRSLKSFALAQTLTLPYKAISAFSSKEKLLNPLSKTSHLSWLFYINITFGLIISKLLV